MNDQKKRKLGQGMKPRGTNETGADPEDEVSADAGQQDPENDTIQEVEEDAVGGGRLESETVEKEAETQTFEKVASEVEKGADSAPTEAETQPSTLEEQLAASIHLDGLVPADTPGAYEGIERAPVDYDDITKVTLQNLESPKPGTYGAIERNPEMEAKLNEHYTAALKAAWPKMQPDRQIDAAVAIIETPAGGYVFGIDTASESSLPESFSLGQQPNGTFGLVISVPEGYIEGIKLQAQLDNMTTEEWVSFRLGEYLESWFYGK